MAITPTIQQCFPVSTKYNPCKAPGYALQEQFTTLMALCHYRMQGRPVKDLKDHIEKAFTESEKNEMNLLITTANDPEKIIQFLANKFPAINKNEYVGKEVQRIYQDLSKMVSPEALNAYKTLRFSEVDATSIAIQPYIEQWDPCCG